MGYVMTFKVHLGQPGLNCYGCQKKKTTKIVVKGVWRQNPFFFQLQYQFIDDTRGGLSLLSDYDEWC